MKRLLIAAALTAATFTAHASPMTDREYCVWVGDTSTRMASVRDAGIPERIVKDAIEGATEGDGMNASRLVLMGIVYHDEYLKGLAPGQVGAELTIDCVAEVSK